MDGDTQSSAKCDGTNDAIFIFEGTWADDDD